jgi:LacI family transcriptional regulator
MARKKRTVDASKRKKNDKPQPHAPRKVTLADVSRLAGVSQATVSMILNGRQGVSFSEETVSAVQKAAETLQYKTVAGRHAASVQAWMTAKSESQTILVVCPNILNAYYGTMIQAIQQSAARKNYDVCVQITYRSLESELAALRLAESAHFAGIIFTMIAYPEEVIPRISPAIPMVVITDRRSYLDVDTVELSNYDAGSQIARHLVELGHRHVACVSTTLDRINSARTQRLQGFQETFQSICPTGTMGVKSRDVSPEMERDDMDIEFTVGYELTRKCLADRKITAFVAVNDMVAYGVIDAVRDAGFRIPEDYSVSGFDNLFPSKFAGVSLTSIEHRIADKGRNAFDMLYARISNHASGHNIINRVEYKSELIVRGSTAAPRSEWSPAPDQGTAHETEKIAR